MALEAALEDLLAEAKCYICLDELKDPVTIECGHNYCRSCMEECRKEEIEEYPCPICRHVCTEENLSTNTQLEKIIDLAKQLQSSGRKKRRRRKMPVRTVCEKHDVIFSRFCETDSELLCSECSGHLDHPVLPLAEAAKKHRENLRKLIKHLKKQIQEVQELRNTQSQKPEELKEQVEAHKQKLSWEFEQLSHFLEREQEAALSRIQAEEEDLAHKLEGNIKAFTNYASALKSLADEVLAQKVLSHVEVLANCRRFSSKSTTRINPPIFSVNLQREVYVLPPQYSALQKLIKQFKEDVTLDPETAHPNLVVSKDKKGVKFSKTKKQVSESSQRFRAHHAVLGCTEFTSGRHFWEVHVGDGPGWAIGVCRTPLTTKDKRSATHPECWRLLRSHEGYEAPGAYSVPPLPHHRAKNIGIFLDYELGDVSFYDMPERSHICTFRNTFKKPLRPYFHIGPHSQPLRVVLPQTE